MGAHVEFSHDGERLVQKEPWSHRHSASGSGPRENPPAWMEPEAPLLPAGTSSLPQADDST